MDLDGLDSSNLSKPESGKFLNKRVFRQFNQFLQVYFWNSTQNCKPRCNFVSFVCDVTHEYVNLT